MARYPLGIEQSNNLAQLVSNDPDRLSQVRVITDHDEGFSVVSEGVDKQVRRQVDVRALFLVFDDLDGLRAHSGGQVTLTTTTSSASSAIDWIRAMSGSSAPSCAVDRVPRLDNLVLLGLVFLGMKGQTLKGHLDLLVLAVLATGPCHGYGVIEGLRVRSGDALDLPEGTVYPVLHRLENAGLLASEWSTECGRRRRTYRLSESGRAALNEERSAWEGFTAAVGSVLKGVPWPIPT